MIYNTSLGLLRILTGSALIGSVAWQVTDRLANNNFRPGEYFAYFSIVTAIVAGAFLVATGFGLVRNQEDSKRIEIARLSFTVAMIVVGVVYHLLLADAPGDVRDGDYVWPVLPNEVIHTYGPILIVIDYLLSHKAFQIKLRAALWVAVFPLTWLVFSVIRGLVTNWWPYWFINPNEEGGVPGMLTYIAAITSFFLILGFLVLGIKKLIQKVVSRN
ncbi:MAG: Pr6Pr family membrane protein [Rhodoluna sp.]|nr:Pr6Pr family membrane protein [Rhodoluna sp.]